MFWIWFSHSPNIEENCVMLLRLPPPQVDPRFLWKKTIIPIIPMFASQHMQILQYEKNQILARSPTRDTAEEVPFDDIDPWAST
jgi:hypothetical protein